MPLLVTISLLLLFSAYILYGLALQLINSIKETVAYKSYNETYLPEISVIIPAYNEEDFILEKIENSLQLDYPESKKKIYVITDGSTDNTPTLIEQHYPQKVSLFHEDTRKGKTAALNRIVPHITTEISLFTDANTMLTSNTLLSMAKRFSNSNIGMVAGEKTVIASKDEQSAQSEGAYWKYESWQKKNEALLHSAMGTAGELFAIRTSLFRDLPEDTLLDDFMLSMYILRQGYRIDYAPEAKAIEYGSVSIAEEMKRKIRIAAGGIQSILRSWDLLAPYRYGWISFCLFTHRFFRWTLAPLLLLVLLMSSAQWMTYSLIGQLFFGTQLFFISLGLALWRFDQLSVPRIRHIPSYSYLMHIAVIAGWFRYFMGKQKINWERAKRITN